MIKKVILMVSLLLVAAVLIPSAVHASVTTTITPSNADTTIKSDDPSTNYGGDTFIEPLHGYTVTIHWYGFVMFDLSSIPSGAIIISANLKLYDTEGNSYYGGPSAFPVYRVNESWNESTLTWNTNLTIESTPTDSLTFGPSDTGYHSWNVTTDVQSFISGTATNYGWCVQISADACWTTFASKEGGSDILPKLEITYADAYLVVRGQDDRVYYRSHNSSSNAWNSWNVLPGSTIDNPAAAMLGGELHVVVRGSNGYSLWYGNLTDPANLTTFSGWTLLDGATSSAPTLTSNGTALCLVVRGLDDHIYYRSYTGSWGPWQAVPTGATPDGPAAAMLGNDLHIIVRGMDGNSLWDTIVSCNGTVLKGWSLLSGATPSKPALAYSGLDNLCLVVRGMDNTIYYRNYTGSTDSWAGWNALPTGATNDGPAATVIGNELCTVVHGSDGNTLWCGNLDLGTSSFTGWTLLSGATPSAPTLTS